MSACGVECAELNEWKIIAFQTKFGQRVLELYFVRNFIGKIFLTLNN